MQHKVLLGVPDRDGLWGLQVNCDAILTLTSATNSAHADGGHRITPQSDNPPHTTRVGVSVVTHTRAVSHFPPHPLQDTFNDRAARKKLPQDGWGSQEDSAQGGGQGGQSPA